MKRFVKYGLIIVVILSLGFYAVNKARNVYHFYGGLSIGGGSARYDANDPNETIDSVRIIAGVGYIYSGGDTIPIYVPVASYDLGVALADSGVLNHGYATPSDLAAIDLSGYINVADTGRFLNTDQLVLRITGPTATLASAPLAESTGCSVGFASAGTFDITDGRATYQAVYLKENKTITGVEFLSADNASVTYDNFNGVALYSYSGGTITQVAISANDGTKWDAAAGNMIKVAFTSPYVATKGLYYVGIMGNYSATTTIPELQACGAASSIQKTDFVVYAATQTALAASVVVADATAADQLFWFILY